MYKYSWSKNFRTFGKAEYFGWNGMPIIGKTNHATKWRFSQKYCINIQYSKSKSKY